jgi:hypothetical protein
MRNHAPLCAVGTHTHLAFGLCARTHGSCGTFSSRNRSLLSVRFQPYTKFLSCKVCKIKTHHPHAHYCSGCAYKIGEDVALPCPARTMNISFVQRTHFIDTVRVQTLTTHLFLSSRCMWGWLGMYVAGICCMCGKQIVSDEKLKTSRQSST